MTRQSISYTPRPFVLAGASLAALLLLPLTALCQPASQPRSVTLAVCIDDAMRLNPSILGRAQATEAAIAGRKSVRGSFGPSVVVGGNVTIWDEETVADFGGAMGTGGADLSLIPQPTTVYETILYEMLKGFGKPTVVQEQVTAQLSASVVQPITPLWTVLKAYQLAGLGIDEARIREEEARTTVALAVVLAYLGFLQARSVVATLEASVVRIEAHQRQMEKLHESELVGKSDVLKVKVAAAELAQAMVRTRNLVELARANLSTQVGWESGTLVEPLEIEHRLPVPPEGTVDESIRVALSRRPELQAMRVQLKQTELGRKIVEAEYIPVVAASGSYLYNRGSTFMDENSFFLRFDLSWPLWEWGKTFYKADEAAARTRQLEFAVDQVRDYVALEVRKTWLDLQTALEEFRAVEVRVAEAEENYRVQKKLYEAEYKTSTDLLDAEAALTEAHAQRDMAFYAAWTASAAYGKAVGSPISSWVPTE